MSVNEADATEPGKLGESSSSASSLSLGGEVARAERIGRFALLHPLGAGAMGHVYAAYDDVLDRKVAIKAIAPQLAEREGARDQMLREAQALARLRHPNVVQVYDAGVDRHGLFIAMELVDGETLAAWAKSGRRWREVIEVYVQAGRGLAAAHEAGLVHRDFKPDNAMLGRDGLVRVMDFGLVRGAQWPGPTESDAKMARVSSRHSPGIAGTPAYMAPEQWSDSEPDARSDQFSFCVALFEALWGMRPFRSESLADLASSIADGRVAKPDDDRDVPDRIRRAVMRGLASDPNDRWPSMDALLRELSFTPRRLRWWIGAAVVGVGIAGAVASVRTPSPCSSAGATLDGMWDDARRSRLRAGLTALPAAYAGDTAARVDAVLTEHAAAQLRARRDACEATHVRHEQSEQLMLQRMRCLDDRERRFRAVAEVLEQADAEVLEHAINVVEALPVVERCNELAYVSAEMPPPEDPSVAREVEAMREEGATIDAFYQAGKYSDALPRAERLLERADALGYAPAQVVARNHLASLLHEIGEYDRALAVARGAYVISDGASLDAQATNHAVLGLLLSQTGDLEASLAEHRKARALWTRAVGPLDTEALKAVNDSGTMLHRIGRHDEALDTFREALDGWADRGEPSHNEAGTVRNNIGVVLHDLGREDEALVEFRAALATAIAQRGAAHPSVAAHQQNVGATLIALGKPDEALVELQAAASIWADALGPRHPTLVAVRNNIASVLLATGRAESALEELEEVWRIALAAHGRDHSDTALVLFTRARALHKLERYEEAVVAVEDALEIWTRVLGPTHTDVARALTRAADSKLGAGRPDDAVADAEQAVAIFAQSELGPERGAGARLVLARALWASGTDRRRALELVEKLRDDDSVEETTRGAARSLVDEWSRSCKRDAAAAWTCPSAE